ncbi:E3 ubiquitin-protein ligase HAKAI homolog [Amaranthus tricolor]|uniref:E3 ubiquitin-protein ligase HAKAI homolog n=1 Tax=Amaranthus tricolor TaxID=29722 RepID=UPI002589CB14|nr:E3 ubiquitin-protein ligase HAKAI homolog [Amaranthus tricolor]
MLQIRLNKGASLDNGTGVKLSPGEIVTVACPDHLVLADLPVAKGLGSATSASIVKIVGRRSRRQLAERVHFCVRCDFPIAIYGRLSPCEHAFCLDCARSDSICYLCDDRIQKIQIIKMMEGIFICAAPHCLKSFLKKSEFESHIHESHANLLQPNMKGETSEPEGSGTKQSSTLDTTLRGPPRSGLPPSSTHQLNDREDKNWRQHPRDQPPVRPSMQSKPPPFYGQSHPSDPQSDNHPMGLDGSSQTRMQQQIDSQGGMQQDFGQFSDKQIGNLPDPHREYPPPMFPQPPPNFQMPGNANPMMMGPPPFGFPPFPSDGAPPFYGAQVPYEIARSDSNGKGGSDQGSMGFAPGPGGPVNFSDGYPRPWNGGPPNVPFEAVQGGQGLMGAPQGMPPPPPPPGPPPPHLVQQKHGYFPGDTSNDGKSYGWQSDRRDSFGSSQD